MLNTIRIRCNNKRLPEKQYIINVLLGELLGLSYLLEIDQTSQSYTIETGEGAISIPDIFLSTSDTEWMQPSTLPVGPFKEWDLSEHRLFENITPHLVPVLHTHDFHLICRVDGNQVSLPADILGTAFFMLSRYEEVIASHLDTHKRFTLRSSVLRFNNLVERPLVNEYVEVLWRVLHFLNPTLIRKKYAFKIIPSCDVDWPYDPTYYGLRGAFRILKKWKSPMEMMKQAWTYAKINIGGWQHDPYNTFDFMMDTFERNQLNGAFYFICDNSKHIIDGVYSIDEPKIKALLKRIDMRGHEIGLHLSYGSYNEPAQARKEYDILSSALKQHQLTQSVDGGRQHFLRWDNSITPLIWDSLNLKYDSTLTFAEYAGFRCGICHDYPMFDLISRRQLNLKQRPLIVMESSVIDERYMNLGYGQKAYEYMMMLKKKVQHYNGNFTLLWHNSHFASEKEMDLFSRILSSN